jgi:hypothetical protein
LSLELDHDVKQLLKNYRCCIVLKNKKFLILVRLVSNCVLKTAFFIGRSMFDKNIDPPQEVHLGIIIQGRTKRR